MSKSKKLSDKQRIKELEQQMLDMRSFFLQSIKNIEEIVGITPDYIHQPVQPIKED
jgi:hypothetical protein